MLRSLLAGALQTGTVVAGVVAFGLGWAWAYTPEPMSEERWLVDGFNVLHAGVLRGSDRRGWWREEMRARLLQRVAAFEDTSAELWVVFDGPGPGAEAERASQRPRVVFAPSADDWLLAAVREAPDPGAVVLVTADRQLADRARHRGARIVSPRTFLARCPGDGPWS
jgi:predicted RNA-binding protein with PIN domain